MNLLLSALVVRIVACQNKYTPVEYPQTLSSPDHRFSLRVTRGDSGSLELSFRDGKTRRQILSSSGSAIQFFGDLEYGVHVLWPSRGSICVVYGSQHISTNETTFYFGIDLARRAKANFVGWTIPHSSKAVVVQGDFTATLDEEHVFGTKTYNTHGPNLYVADVPADLSKYTFASASKKPLIFKGKTLQLGQADMSQLPIITVLHYGSTGYRTIGKFNVLKGH